MLQKLHLFTLLLELGIVMATKKPKGGTLEANKFYALVCVTMTTAKFVTSVKSFELFASFCAMYHLVSKLL